MAKIRLVLADTEEDYVAALVNYILRHYGDEIEAAAFTRTESLREYLEQSDAQVLLLGEEFAESVENREEKGRICYLTRGESDRELLWDENALVLEKYEAADEILRKALEGIKEGSRPGVRSADANRPNIIWCYSPAKSRYGTPFAYTYSQMLAKKSKVLYVNLCENAVFDWMFLESFEVDLAHAFYLLRQKKEMTEILKTVIFRQDGVDLIPPMKSALDLAEPTPEEWQQFYEGLFLQTDYDHIVIDTETVLGGSSVLLNESRKIYVISEDNEYENARSRSFLDVCYPKVNSEGKIESVALPSMRLPYRGESLGKLWLYGEIGDVVRNYV